MIKIDRYRKEKGKIIQPSGDWMQKAAGKTRQAVEDGPDHEVSDFYRDRRVKAALEKLFHNKCAYCESDLKTSDWDIDHYRPKGRVAECPDHEGYYWLAYTWENLYPSCKHCNQKRKDHPRYDEPRTLPAKGKHDQFPLEDDGHRAMKPEDQLNTERPLLLDPCNDNPEKYLTYDIQGHIYPLESGNRFAEETIRICHLQRSRLRKSRANAMTYVKLIVEAIHKAQRAENDEVLKDLEELLEKYTASDSCYAAAARAAKKMWESQLNSL